MVSDGTLSPDELTAIRNITFRNPDEVPFTYDLVLAGKLNRPPAFTTVPKVSAIAGKPYLYDFAAVDPDGNPITYSLVAGPAGVNFDAANSLISWTPQPPDANGLGDVGNHTIVLRAEDGRGGRTEQEYILTVLAPPPNSAPFFTSLPVTAANVNVLYTYAAKAFDPDQDPTTITLTGGPAGMVWDAADQRLEWTPTAGQLGTHTVTLSVTDGHLSNSQTFSVLVAQQPGNHAPVIVSEPAVKRVLLGETFEYDVDAIDADGDALTYALLQKPSGMTIDPASGRIAWTASATGPHTIDVQVADTRGGIDTQLFTLIVEQVPGASILGTLFDDVDRDGLRDTGEGALVGWTVFLDQNRNGLLELGERFVVSDGAGGYSFTSLAAGTYTVAQVRQVGWVQTAPGAGTHQVTLQAGQVQSGIIFGNYQSTLAENQPPTITSSPPLEVVVGTLWRYEVKATDPNGDLLTFDLPVKPTGMTIDAASAIAIWTPTLAQEGTHDVIVRVQDGKGGVYLQQFQIVAYRPNTPPVITSSPDGPAVIGKPYQYQVVAQDADNDALAYTLNSGPSGMTIDAATGLLTWTPTAVQEGQHPVSLTVSDGRGGTATQSFTLTAATSVTNDPPTITSTPPSPAIVGWQYVYSIKASDPNGDLLTYELVSGPAGMSVEPATGRLTWLPTAADVPSFTASVIVRDGRGSYAQQTFTVLVVVDAPNDPPAITSTPPGPAVTGYPYVYQVVASDPNGDTLHYRLDRAPSGMTINTATGRLEWTPWFSSGTSVNVTVSVSDGRGGTATQSFVLNVVDDPYTSNRAPQITSTPPGPAVENHPYRYQVVASDPDGEPLMYDFDYMMGMPPPGMTIDSQTGLLTWTPQTGDAGSYQFRIVVDDGRFGQAYQDITLQVLTEAQANNRPPDITSTPPGPAVTGVPYKYQVVASDPDGDPLTYSITAGDPDATISASGLFQWKPLPGEEGVRQFTIAVTDTWGASRTQTFDLTVLVGAPNDPPIIDSTPPGPAGVFLPYVYQVVARDPNGDPLSYRLEVAPVGMQISSTGRITWTPFAAGGYPVEVVVSDDRFAETRQTFTLTVHNNPTNRNPQISSTPPAPAVVGLPYFYDVVASDPDGDPLTFQLTQAPIGMTISSGGRVIWVPAANQVGTHTVSIAVSDGRGGSATQTFDLPVQNGAINHPPQIVSQPRLRVQLGRQYLYLVQVEEPDGDPVTFALPIKPAGMTISAAGLVAWTPTAEQLGKHTVKIEATDGRGGYDAQQFTVEVVAQDKNLPPKITSSPSLTAVVGKSYRYDAVAEDPENDTLVWSLVAAPIGMSIDPLRGTILWTPLPEQVGPQTVTVRVLDTQAGQDTQTFTINVRAANTNPIITSTPPVRAYVDKLYLYSVRAVDPDGDPLTFTLTQKPDGMTIDSFGVIRWTPDYLDVGPHTIAVQVTDGQGGGIIQQYRLDVFESIPGGGGSQDSNRAPVITSSPPLSASIGALYQYFVKATDPDGDAITFELTEFPAGMTIDPASGVINWTPSADPSQLGEHYVTVLAKDPYGLGSKQRYKLTVKPANPNPAVTSTPPTTITAGLKYRYDVQVDEPDGDPVTFKLITGPTGLTLDDLGRVEWVTAIADIGQHSVEIVVADDRGGSASHSFTITVQADTQAPKVELKANPNTGINLGDNVTFSVLDSDNVGVVERKLTVGGQNVSLDSYGNATVTMTQTGWITATATVKDAAGLSATTSIQAFVKDPNNLAPQPSFTSPADRAVVTAPTTIKATITDSENDLVRYTLSFAPLDGSTGYKVITDVQAQSGQTLANFTDQPIGTFDPTLLRNGAYLLRLDATDANQSTTSVEQIVNVAGRLKLGNFTVSFTDVTIPVAGIPITITRTYDTLDANRVGDFGYGWRLEIKDAQLEVDLTTVGSVGFNGYPAFVDGTRVKVTMPDGSTEGFTFQGVPGQTLFGIPLDWRPAFIPDAGNRSLLKVPQVALLKVGSEYWDAEGASYNPADPRFGNQYTLTSYPEKLSRIVNARTGQVTAVEDKNGNRVTYTDDGAISNRGRKLDFVRDHRGRITKIIDPRGNYLLYEYDADGNLVRFYDRVNSAARTNPVVYTYLGPSAGEQYAHYLDQIKDPYGRQAVKTTYAASGRLSAMTDADGQSVGLSYDTVHLTTTITDQLGKSASVAFDALGNVTREQNQVGDVLWRTFQSGTPFVTSETLVIGQPDTPQNGETNDLKTTYEVSSLGLPTKQTDPLGNATRTTYDAEGRPISVTDALGNTTYHTYDDKGNLVSTTDPLGNTTLFEYDPHGNVTKITTGIHYGSGGCDPMFDPDCGSQGVVTRFEYNTFGELTKAIDPQNNARTVSYDANGNRTGTSFTWTNPSDPNDQRTVATASGYDANDRGTSSTSPSGTTSTDYDHLNRAVRTTSELGLASETLYDTRGLTIQTQQEGKDQAGASVWLVSRTVYDAAGRPIYATNPHPEGTPAAEITGTHSIYDDAGRVIATEQRKGLVIDVVGAPNNPSAVLTSAGSVISTSSSVYSDHGRLLSTTDIYGRQTQQLYDRFGRTIETRTQSRDENGVDVWLVSRTKYDQYGRTELVTDQFLLAGSCALGACASPPVRATRTIYDNKGRVVKTERLKDVVVEIQSGSPVVTSAGTLLHFTQTIYNERGQVQRSIAADGQKIDYEYDVQGRQTATIGHPLPAEEVGLGGQYPGKLVRHRTEFEYSQYGQRHKEKTNIIQVENPDGTLVTIHRDNARTTQFEFDQFGNRTKTIFPDGSFVLVRYDQFNRQTAESQQVAAGTSVIWSESAKSFIVSGSNPVQTIPTKLYEYDGQGRLSAVELPAVPNPHNGNQLTRPRYEYGYNGQGNQTLIRDPLGRETRFTFDVQGRQLTRTLPLGFGPDGRLGTGDDANLPEGQFRERFEYDDQGRQKLHVSFEGVVTQSLYDSYGRLSQQKFFASETAYNHDAGTPGEVWTYKYDAFGRQAEVRQESAGQSARISTMQYDAEGRLAVQSTPEGVIAYTYDHLGRQTATKVYPAGANPGVDTPERVTSYTYDALSRLKTVSEDLDPASTADQPLHTSYAYDLRGNLDRTDLPGGLITDYVFDQLDRLDKQTDYAADATPSDLSDNPKLAEFDYTVRPDGKRTSVTETFWLDADNNPSTAPTPHVHHISWTYDEIGRLTDEVFNHFDNSLDQTERFVYDLVGNRLSLTKDLGNNGTLDEAIAYLYDANDRLTTESLDTGNNGSVDQTTAYGWTRTQQTGKIVTPASSSATSAVAFSYDLQGRMAQVVTETYSGGSPTRRERVTYDYDAAGIRVSSLHEVDADASGTYESRVRTEYLVDHQNFTGYQQVIKEAHFSADSGAILKTVEYTIGHDEIAQTVTEYDAAGNVASTTTHVFGHDGHGSVRVLYDLAGAIVQLFAFDAYGQLLAIHHGAAQFVSASPAAALTSLLYSGEHFDARIAQQYLRARYYDPSTGRFNRLDTYFGKLTDPLSVHKYVYTPQDPVNYQDPLGNSWLSQTLISIHIGISTVVSYGTPILLVAWEAALIWTATFLLWAIIEELVWGEVSAPTEWGLNIGLYALQVLTIVTSLGLLYPATPIRLQDRGGLRWGAQRIHQRAGVTQRRELNRKVVDEEWFSESSFGGRGGENLWRAGRLFAFLAGIGSGLFRTTLVGVEQCGGEALA